MLKAMEACYRAAGIKHKQGNAGRCAECHRSAKITAGAPGSAHIGWLWCYKYDNLCKRVAWNCERR